MTEAEWLACTDSRAMLKSLERKVSDRKLRLFAVACIRPISHLFTDDGSREAVEVLERLPDESVTGGERVRATRHARYAYHEAESVGDDARLFAGLGLYRALIASPFIAAQEARLWSANASHATSGGVECEQEAQCQLLRDIFGNPFRPVTVDPAWASWKDGTLVKLAEAIYEDRAFDRLLILADALEESGCDNADILNHCRGPGPHTKGCWVVDLILGKS